MNEIFVNSVFFGVTLTLASYFLGVFIKEHFNVPVLNPMIMSVVFVIVLLIVTHTSYETYNNGAKYINDFLTPATVCLAVPMYKQIEILRKNMAAVIAGILAGCIGHAAVVVGLGIALALDRTLIVSVLPKSVTTAIAMGVCEESGGIVAVVIVGVTVAGNIGAIFGPAILKALKINDPVAQGLAIGCCSHALGTSTAAVPMGEIQGAMSSLAIVVTGIMTVVIVPIVAGMI